GGGPGGSGERKTAVPNPAAWRASASASASPPTAASISGTGSPSAASRTAPPTSQTGTPSRRARRASARTSGRRRRPAIASSIRFDGAPADDAMNRPPIGRAGSPATARKGATILRMSSAPPVVTPGTPGTASQSPIGPETVRAIAALARLRLPEEDLGLWSRQLSRIVEYIDQLKRIPEEAFGDPVSGPATPLRDDSPRPGHGAEALEANAPRLLHGYGVVPRVGGQGSGPDSRPGSAGNGRRGRLGPPPRDRRRRGLPLPNRGRRRADPRVPGGYRRARAGGGPRRGRPRGRGRAPAAGRRAARGQGQHLDRRTAGDVCVEDPRPLPAAGRLHGRRAAPGGAR